MYVDVSYAGGSASTQWLAESGVLDVFIMLGRAPADVSRQMATLTGGSALPQMFALGYHQCRWNYKDEAGAPWFAELASFGIPKPTFSPSLHPFLTTLQSPSLPAAPPPQT